MNFYRRFPYTNLNDINLDWIIKKVKALIGLVDEKQNKPANTGVAGQVLGLDENLNPVWLDQTGGGGGTTNYNDLINKPQIEGATLSGNKTAAELGLARASDVPTKTSDLANDSGFVNATEAGAAAPVQSVNGMTGNVAITVPSASSTLPQMDGIASAGSNFSQFARADHVHPTDTSRASADYFSLVQLSYTLNTTYFSLRDWGHIDIYKAGPFVICGIAGLYSTVDVPLNTPAFTINEGVSKCNILVPLTDRESVKGQAFVAENQNSVRISGAKADQTMSGEITFIM